MRPLLNADRDMVPTSLTKSLIACVFRCGLGAFRLHEAFLLISLPGPAPRPVLACGGRSAPPSVGSGRPWRPSPGSPGVRRVAPSPLLVREVAPGYRSRLWVTMLAQGRFSAEAKFLFLHLLSRRLLKNYWTTGLTAAQAPPSLKPP